LTDISQVLTASIIKAVSGVYEGECLLRFYAVYSRRDLPTFRRRLLLPSSRR